MLGRPSRSRLLGVLAAILVIHALITLLLWTQRQRHLALGRRSAERLAHSLELLTAREVHAGDLTLIGIADLIPLTPIRRDHDPLCQATVRRSPDRDRARLGDVGASVLPARGREPAGSPVSHVA